MSTVTEIESAIERLSPAEQRELERWVDERRLARESPALLAAIDEGARSLAEHGARVYTRDELAGKVRAWSGASR